MADSAHVEREGYANWHKLTTGMRDRKKNLKGSYVYRARRNEKLW